MSQPRQSIDEILRAYGVWIADSRGGMTFSEAKEALNQDKLDSFLELIGKDAPQPVNNLDFGKNELRNQLRQAAKERFK